MSKGYVYILECSDGTYYTGSTIDIEKRIAQHNDGKGSNHTKKRLPVELVYFEEFQRIDDAFRREKQIQGWSRAKKEALINNNFESLKSLSECKNDSHYKLWLRLRSANENRLRSAIENQIENKNSKTYRSNGKLILTGEYVVLDGAKALAIPTKYGQSLTVEPNDTKTIIWKSFDEKGNVWFEHEFALKDNEIQKHTSTKPSIRVQNDNQVSVRLLEILKVAQELNSEFLSDNQGYNVTTHQDFNRKWGLGTSSTLINNIADWAEVNAYQLLHKTFGGSGYDIACAQTQRPITYRIIDKKQRLVEPAFFNPRFKDNLYFVYLNQKQNSRDGIASYRKNAKIDRTIIEEVNAITEAIVLCESLSEFETLINKHETIIARLIKQDTIKFRLFKDYNGSIKSLGAWGGDFILVTSESNPKHYFKSKGFDTIIPYDEMVLR
ncbi:GYDIA family GHMP kinase [Winogradskyella luteola]|uniref:GIY-YIG nuclease family protein n=1 Tax=Winogradskyella luteola TaxID=2828330 RepID=A0A9X1F8G3_9FLAO|nr:GIY-YIG nuclease family protein [Winogradskyella luteola]